MATAWDLSTAVFCGVTLDQGRSPAKELRRGCTDGLAGAIAGVLFQSSSLGSDCVMLCIKAMTLEGGYHLYCSYQLCKQRPRSIIESEVHSRAQAQEHRTCNLKPRTSP